MLSEAIFKVMYLPFLLIIDKWRWGVYSGNISPKEYNLRWWEMIEKYQGLKAPVERKADGMDIGRISHIVHGIPTVRLVLFIKLVMLVQAKLLRNCFCGKCFLLSSMKIYAIFLTD